MKVPSFTFAGGVISKGLWGRVDLNKYLTGLKVANNFNVAVEGGAAKRAGLYYVGKPKYQDKVCKLVPWKIASDDSYMMEFGDNYIRFIRFGGYVSIPGGHVALPGNEAANVGGVMEVSTTYTADECRELKFTYANDICYIFHKNHPPAQLKRLGLFDWSLTDTGFNPHGAAPTGLAGLWQHYRQSVDTWDNSSVPGTNLEDGYDTNPTDYKYLVSATMGNGLETMPSAPITVKADLGHPSYRVYLTWDALAGAEQYTIYKGKNGIYGFIGYVDAADPRVYEDRNIAPSYDTVPYKAFEGFTGGGYPRVGEFYKQRMSYAAPEGDEQTIWFSRPLFFDSMTTSIPTQDDDSIKATLVGRERQTINHIIQLKKFLVFTDGGEWVFSPENGQALTAATFDPVEETTYGSDPFLKPLVIGDRILFPENISGTIRDMGYQFTADSYQADDLSRLARDLFKNKKITSWDYSAYPSNLVTCVCNDGSVNQMTYVREHEIWGWTTYETNGVVTDIASVVEITENAEYFQVTRTINGVATKFIERTEITLNDQIEDMFFVDCGLRYEDKRSFTSLVQVDSVDLTITSASHGRVIGDEIRVYTPEVDQHFLVTNVVGDVLTLVSKLNKPLGALTVTSGSWWPCSSSITGFNHLASQSGLVALADGKVVRDLTASAGGVISLPFKASKVVAGFPYVADLETLDIDVDGASGRYNYRSVNRIILRLENSRGIYAGASEAIYHDLVLIPGRADEDYDEANSPLNGPYEVPSHTAWAMTCGVKVRSVDPLPARILNIIPDLEYGA